MSSGYLMKTSDPGMNKMLVLANAERFKAFDLLATLIAVVQSDGAVLFANAALEDARGLSRRAIVGSYFPDSFTQPALRYDAWLLRLARDPLPVNVIISLTEGPEIIVELLPPAGVRTVRNAWPNRHRPTKSSSATWPTRSRTHWAAFVVRPSC
jgi:PAS domain-containing protein